MPQSYARPDPRLADRPISAVDTFTRAAAGILPVVALLWVLWLAAMWLTRGL